MPHRGRFRGCQLPTGGRYPTPRIMRGGEGLEEQFCRTYPGRPRSPVAISALACTGACALVLVSSCTPSRSITMPVDTWQSRCNSAGSSGGGQPHGHGYHRRDEPTEIVVPIWISGCPCCGAHVAVLLRLRVVSAHLAPTGRAEVYTEWPREYRYRGASPRRFGSTALCQNSDPPRCSYSA